jgi:hypothetical protein
MTYYAKLWTDILDDPKLIRAARQGAKHLVYLPWLFAFAKRADDDGRLTVAGLPAEPVDIARSIPGGNVKHIAECLRWLVGIGVLVADDDGALRFAAWGRRNWMAPSDTPDQVRDRVAKHRAKRRSVTTHVTDEVTPIVTTSVTGEVTTARSRDIDLDRDQDKNKENNTADAAASEPSKNWPARLTEHFQREVGHVALGHLAKVLKPFVDRDGVEIIETAITYYALERRALGRAGKFAWFAEGIAQWIDNAKQPLQLDDGTFTPLGERLYGLNGTRR